MCVFLPLIKFVLVAFALSCSSRAINAFVARNALWAVYMWIMCHAFKLLFLTEHGENFSVVLEKIVILKNHDYSEGRKI